MRGLIVRAGDPLVRRRLERVAKTFAAEVVDGLPDGAEPIGLAVELEQDGAVEVIAAWRAAHPGLGIGAYLSTPDPALWREAEKAGADLVTTRGRFDRELARLLEDRLSGRHRARRIRLASEKEFAGRLGFVGRVDETPVGPIAIFHIGNGLYAVGDTCPHAGASLCGGDLDGDVLTCPRHGSQFRVTDGERVRGPADVPIPRFPVVVEAGEVFIELPETAP